MKKIYLKPDIKIVDIKPTQLLIASGDTQLTIPVVTEPEEPINDGKDVW
ncbi:MAG: hypothetical protein IJ897_01470 [Prevotella sp.]|nr:hypothetical protein [Prevotella sp.]